MTIGIIGFGAFGTLLKELIERFLPDATIRVFSPEQTPDGNLFLSFEEVCTSDVVFLTVPISAFEQVVERILPLLAPTSIVVDISTVKVHTTELLRRLMPDRPWISTHPMFGPESVKKRDGDIIGFRLVICDDTLKEGMREILTTFLSERGLKVIAMTSEEHDKHVAETLFLTHFVGQVLTRTGVARSPIDTVSFGLLMDAVEIVKNDTALFADMYRFNPFCKDVMDRIDQAELKIRDILEGSEKP